MYTQRTSTPEQKSAVCPQCHSKRIRYTYSKLICTNCDYVIAKGNVKGTNKYGAVKTVAADGMKRDSKYEASVADNLYVRKLAGDILDYESQYKVEMWVYREDGVKAFVVKHKVDFRVHHNDGSFELLEAKGVETADYKFRRKLLEELWLPMHKDHIYTVVKQNSNRKYKRG
jgi:ribosomal protein L37AE/L43A